MEIKNGKLSQKNIFIADGEDISLSVLLTPKKSGVYFLIATLNSRTLRTRIVNGKVTIPYTFIESAGTGDLVFDIQRLSENQQTVFESIKCDTLIVQRSVNGGFEGCSFMHKVEDKLDEIERLINAQNDAQRLQNEAFEKSLEEAEKKESSDYRALDDCIRRLNNELNGDNGIKSLLSEIKTQVYGG